MINNSAGLEDQIANAIQKTAHLNGRTLRYENKDGTVTLHGTVGSYFQKQMAQEAVRRVDGVENVSNQLQVAWSEAETDAVVSS
ncbi:MAG: BON domain-containing protein [Planctomycetota bacterium]